MSAVPAAGRIAFYAPENGVWSYDGASGQLQRFDAYRSVATSDGRALPLLVAGMAKLVPVLDLRDGSQRSLPVPTSLYDVTAGGTAFAYIWNGTLYVKNERPLRAVFPEYRFTSVLWSPSGRRLALTGRPLYELVADPTPLGRAAGLSCDLWLVDLDARTLRQVFVEEMFMNSNGSAVCGGLELGTWSPDERYLTVYLSVPVSAAGAADPLPLGVVDLLSGTVVRLGTTVRARGWQAWRAPHDLAYIAAAGRNGWDQRVLRVWSPEQGLRGLTAASEAAIDPVWDPLGSGIYFITAAAGPWNTDDYFAGRGIGARHIVWIDPATMQRRGSAVTPGYVEEGFRVASDGKDLLVARRRTGDPQGLELWLFPVTLPRYVNSELLSVNAVALIRSPLGRFDTEQLGMRSGFDVTYWSLTTTGSYAVFDTIAWSR